MDELRVVTFNSMEDVQKILQNYQKTDVPRDPGDLFVQHLLMRKDSYFVDAGGKGLLYLTEVVPYNNANFHVIFWDARLGRGRFQLAQGFLKHCFRIFKLVRITATVVESKTARNPGAMRRYLKGAGFSQEGLLRNAQVIDNTPVNLAVFGILPNEAAWPQLTTSLDKTL